MALAAAPEATSTGERALLREATARFMRDYDSVARIHKLRDGEALFDEAAWRLGAELGWTSLLVPEDHGGGSATSEPLLDLVEIAEELGRVLHTAPVLPTNVVAFAIAEFGSEALKQDYLPGIVAGRTIGAWCASGVSPSDGDVVAVPSGDGFELRGTARFVQDGAAAGLYLVTAGTGGEFTDQESTASVAAPPHPTLSPSGGEGFIFSPSPPLGERVGVRGSGAPEPGHLTQFLVRRDTPGVVSKPMSCFDLCRQVSEVRFDSVSVLASAVVGQVGQAASDAARQLDIALVLQCADSVGALGRVNEITFEYAKDRFAFGRAIGSFQAIKHKCVEMYLDHLGARSALAAAAEAVQARSPQAGTLVHIAKAYIGDAYSRAVEHCHQIHGGISFTWDHDAHLYSRHAKFNAAMFGSPDWHRDRLAQELGI